MIQILQQIISTLAAMVFALQATVAGLPANNQFAQVLRTSTLTLSPSSTSVSVNNTFTANIIIDTGSQNAYGADINSLRFNPNILQVVDSDSLTAGVQIAAGNLMSLTITNSVNNTGGSIQFSQLATPGSTFSGSGTLATITFRAVSIGASNVTFDFTLGSGIDTNVAGLGGDLLTSVGSGSYTGGTASDTIAPSAPGTPSLTVVSSSQINLSWTASTDNVAVTGYRVERCSGSTTCSNYSQIATPSTNSYSNTGISADTIYRYRIRSVDAAGNLSSYSSTANITSISATTPPVSISVQRKIILVLEGTPTNKRNISGTVEFLNPSNISSKIFQSSFTTNTSGQYTIDVPAGLLSTVTFRPVILGYLSRLLANIDLISTSILNANIPILPAGDFNGDQLINSIDFSYMNDRWGTADSLSDINRDGVINSLDFAYISSNWLLSGE